MTDLSRETRERLTEAWHASTQTPSAQDLAAAPCLEAWFAVRTMTGRPLLVGEVEGHPELQGPKISTSPVMKIDLEQGYARTQSRWYRLGRPMADTDPEELARLRTIGTPFVTIVDGEEFLAIVQQECDRIAEALSAHRPDA